MPALSLHVKFNGNPLVIESLGLDSTVADLKLELFRLTNVLPETQKILGLRRINNLPLDDSNTLSEFILKPNTKLMLIGSTEEDINKVKKTAETVPEVIDDFDFKEQDVQICFLPENVEKVRRRSKAYRARKLCEPRPGKHLLVLDVDYTIFDHLTPAESARQLARPYLHEFLSRAYVDYDIAIWSATSMTWILAKLSQLGVIPSNANAILRQNAHSLTATTSSSNSMLESSSDQSQQLDPPVQQQPSEQSNPAELSFKVSLLLDSSDMISVHFPTHGVKEVKPLAVIWDNHPQWGSHNTIMFDDIRRNFIMNPKNGLRIRSYRDAHVNYKTDRELRGLARYLELIAQNETDFTKVNHNHWERYISKCKRAKRQVSTPDAVSPTSHMQPQTDRRLVQDTTTINSITSNLPECGESRSSEKQTEALADATQSHDGVTPKPGAVNTPGDAPDSTPH